MKFAGFISSISALAIFAPCVSGRLHACDGLASDAPRRQTGRAVLQLPLGVPRPSFLGRENRPRPRAPRRMTLPSTRGRTLPPSVSEAVDYNAFDSRTGQQDAARKTRLVRRRASEADVSLYASAAAGGLNNNGDTNNGKQRQRPSSGKQLAAGDATTPRTAAAAHELVVLRRRNGKKLPLSQLESKYANEAMGRRRLQSLPSAGAGAEREQQQPKPDTASDATDTLTLHGFRRLLALRDDCAELERARLVLAESGVRATPRQLAVALAECRRGVAQLREIALAWAVEDGLVTADEAARAAAVLAQLQLLQEEADRRRGLALVHAEEGSGGVSAASDKQDQPRRWAQTRFVSGRQGRERGWSAASRSLRDWAVRMVEMDMSGVNGFGRGLKDLDAFSARRRVTEAVASVPRALSAAVTKPVTNDGRRQLRPNSATPTKVFRPFGRVGF